MFWHRLIFWLIFSIYWCNGELGEATTTVPTSAPATPTPRPEPPRTLKTSFSVLSETISKAVKDEGSHEACNAEDIACFTMAGNDKLGLEAIMALHNQLDDDRNGNVDLSETDDFLREELKYDSGYERRQKAFHRNDDTHISVKELWEAWLRSEVHNWTIEQTCDWLSTNVELPQYVTSFITHKIAGSTLPRLAANNMQLLTMLGIKDPIHKQKIALKAMDVVLFGPPKDHQTHWKDLTLIVLVIGVAVGSWYALQQNKKFKRHLHRMNRDMEGLQNAERALEDLQKELEQARQAQENVATEKENLEKRLQEAAGADSTGLHTSYSDLEISQLKQEIEMLRHELQIAEGELKDRCWSPPPGLQQWLQLTHEIENRTYQKKRLSAEKQLQHAREACEKLRKKRSSLVGAFVSTHGKSIDDVDRSIVEARTSLTEVTHDLQERVHRWKQIEMMCGFNIINNSGLQQLESTLYKSLNGRGIFGSRCRMSSQDDLDDDTSSLYTATAGLSDMGVLHAWREDDSSESETSRREDDSGDVKSTGVHFLVGEGPSTFDEPPSIPKSLRFPSTIRSSSNNNILGSSVKPSPMTRSQSQDINLNPPDHLTLHPKVSQSETSLDRPPRLKGMKQIREQPLICIEDEVCSTDSSLAEDEVKKRKRKLFGFAKKGKGKGD